jgi:copper chaperone
MATKTLNVPRISCQHCVGTIERTLGALEQVKEVTADATTKMVAVTYGDPEDLKVILDTLEEIGYPAKQ